MSRDSPPGAPRGQCGVVLVGQQVQIPDAGIGGVGHRGEHPGEHVNKPIHRRTINGFGVCGDPQSECVTGKYCDGDRIVGGVTTAEFNHRQSATGAIGSILCCKGIGGERVIFVGDKGVEKVAYPDDFLEVSQWGVVMVQQSGVGALDLVENTGACRVSGVKSWEVVYLPSAETMRVTPDQGPSQGLIPPQAHAASCTRSSPSTSMMLVPITVRVCSSSSATCTASAGSSHHAARRAPPRPDGPPHRGWGSPTTSVRRRISRFSRSVGLLDQTLVHTAFGAVVNASSSSSASSR